MGRMPYARGWPTPRSGWRRPPPGEPARQSADLLTNVTARVSGDTATASSRFTFIGENDAHQFMVTGSGLYRDTWAREDGHWRIRRRAVKWDLLAGQSASAAPQAK